MSSSVRCAQWRPAVLRAAERRAGLRGLILVMTAGAELLD